MLLFGSSDAIISTKGGTIIEQMNNLTVLKIPNELLSMDKDVTRYRIAPIINNIIRYDNFRVFLSILILPNSMPITKIGNRPIVRFTGGYQGK